MKTSTRWIKRLEWLLWCVVLVVLARHGWARAEGKPPLPLPSVFRSNIQEFRLQVYIHGAVHRPGSYTLPVGARVLDALLEAGGTMPDANLADLNMVATLSDGAALFIASGKDKSAVSALQQTLPLPVAALPASGPPALKESGSGGRAGKQAPDHKINLNRAGADELAQLPGIGLKMAQDIVAYRQQLGRYRALAELRKIRGIGERRLARIKDFVAL